MGIVRFALRFPYTLFAHWRFGGSGVSREAHAPFGRDRADRHHQRRPGERNAGTIQPQPRNTSQREACCRHRCDQTKNNRGPPPIRGAAGYSRGKSITSMIERLVPASPGRKVSVTDNAERDRRNRRTEYRARCANRRLRERNSKGNPILKEAPATRQ